MRKKIFRSVFAVALIVLLASIGIATSILYDYFNASQIKRLKAELSLVADTVNVVGAEYFDSFASSVFRFTLVDEEGTVLYDNQAKTDEMENHGDREEIREAISAGSGSSARYSATLTEKTFYEAVRLENGDVLRISVSQLTVGALLVGMLPAILSIMLIAAVMALLLSHGMAKKVTEPLMHLDLDHPGENDAYEELTPILNKIQYQHRQIKLQMDTLRRKSDEFQQIISSMNEGLVLLDEHGMVLRMNASARKIFSVEKDMEGSDFLLVDRTSKVSRSVWSALEGMHSEYSLQKNGNEFQFTVSPIASEGKILGAVILAFDISEKAFAERNRREFTANVTHELKTPLQSIIGSAELLESGLVKPEDTPRFVGTIRKEATRLVSLIDDIIRLSQLDENCEPPTETVDLTEVATEVLETLKPFAEQRKVKFSLCSESCTIIGVRRYLYEIIYNLCDNAIRYNKENGSVSVCIGKEKEKNVISVSDTGIGIPPEHQSRIFERFYRVDKSHSKSTGGTGLGLSIVKHALQYHNGKIELTSEAERGTAITVKLP